MVNSHSFPRVSWYMPHPGLFTVPETAGNEMVVVPFMTKAGIAVDCGGRMNSQRPGWAGEAGLRRCGCPGLAWSPPRERAHSGSCRGEGELRRRKGGACGSEAWEVAGAGLGGWEVLSLPPMPASPMCPCLCELTLPHLHLLSAHPLPPVPRRETPLGAGT